jgi:hypothetical protein
VKALVEADLLRSHREFVLRRQLAATRQALAQVAQQHKRNASPTKPRAADAGKALGQAAAAAAAAAEEEEADGDGDDGDGAADPAAKLAAALAALPVAGGCRAQAKRELARLEQLPSQSPEYGPLKVPARASSLL